MTALLVLLMSCAGGGDPGKDAGGAESGAADGGSTDSGTTEGTDSGTTDGTDGGTDGGTDSGGTDGGTDSGGTEDPLLFDAGDDHLARIAWVASETAGDEGLVIRVVWPRAAAARYADGLPVVLRVRGDTDADHVGIPGDPIEVPLPGIVLVDLALPGGGRGEWRSGGEDDRRGADSAHALRDVLAFILGDGRTTDDRSFADLLDQPIDPGAVGLLGQSYGGNLVFQTLARDDAPEPCFATAWSAPIQDQYAVADMGVQAEDPDPGVDADGDGIGWNDWVDPLYEVGSCGLRGCPLSYTDIAWSGTTLFRDTDGDGVLGDGAGSLDEDGSGGLSAEEDFAWGAVEDPRGRLVFSVPLLEAVEEAGLFADAWPDALAPPDKARLFWEERLADPVLDDLPPGIAVMVLSTSKGHLHAALDQPDVWLLYDRLSASTADGRFLRLNPDHAYLAAQDPTAPVDALAALPEHSAGARVDLSDLPDALPDARWLAELIPAGVYELADRCHLDRWDDDLDAPLVTPPSSPSPGDR